MFSYFVALCPWDYKKTLRLTTRAPLATPKCTAERATTDKEQETKYISSLGPKKFPFRSRIFSIFEQEAATRVGVTTRNRNSDIQLASVLRHTARESGLIR